MFFGISIKQVIILLLHDSFKQVGSQYLISTSDQAGNILIDLLLQLAVVCDY